MTTAGTPGGRTRLRRLLRGMASALLVLLALPGAQTALADDGDPLGTITVLVEAPDSGPTPERTFALHPLASGGAPDGEPLATAATDEAGVATFTALPQGSYLVEEVDPAPGQPYSRPVEVSLPHRSPEGDVVLDVEVHLKSEPPSVLGLALEDSRAKILGDQIRWSLTWDMRDGSEAERLYLHLPVPDSVDTPQVSVSIDGEPAEAEVEFTSDGQAGVLEVRLAPTALGLLAGSATPRVLVGLTSSATAVGEIPLHGELRTFDAPDEPYTSSPTLVTKWGNVTIRTHDPLERPLPGATYQVFDTETDAVAGTDPITLEGVSDWTSDGEGLITVEGLRFSAHEDGGSVTPESPGFNSYWLRQTAPPEGFEPLAAPVPLLVRTLDASVDYEIELIPVRSTDPLPFVGGADARWLVMTGGGVLLVGALVARFVLQRRQRAHAQGSEGEA